MKIHRLHSWNVSPRQASRIQSRLKKRVRLKKSFRKLKFIAGCDLAFTKDENVAYGGVIVYRWPDLEEVERRSAARKLTFPYIPGLLAFREAPVLLECIAKLEHEPDLFIFDGQGIAHPRGLGIASHLGLFLGRPAIGCAKSRLIGTFEDPGGKRGDSSPLLSKEGKVIGAVVRTRDRVKPIFVSAGHKIDLESSVKIILDCVDGYRIPKPTREADHFVEAVKREVRSASYQESTPATAR